MSTSSFNTLLNNLHGGSGRPLADQESSYVEINTRRQFYVSSTYNTIIAYEGDTNSQLIVFNCPKYHENHDLSACTYKKLRWRNVAARTEGLSDLSTAANPNDTNAQLLTWTVPPEAFAKSGNIDLTISCYDLDANNKTAFAWNTGTFSELKVGKTIGVGGIQGNTGNQLRQAKNEILFIDLEHRSIVAPEDYNYIIASYGETGITKVYFETPKYFKGQDLSSATIKITATLGKTTTITTITASDKYTPFANDSNDQGLIGFVWSVPTDITCNAEYKTGAITFAIAFEITGGKIIRTSPYANLRIRESYIKDSGPFSQSKSYFLDGNSNTISDTIESIGGIVKLRRDEDNSSTVNKNELILCFDPTTKEFSGIKLGTADDQDLANAANIITSANIVSALGFTPANADEVLNTSNVDQFVRLVGGKIPSTYLPSYVDDVVFFESADLLTDPEQKGEPGKIYFVTGSTGGYRWAEDNSERGGRFVLVTSNLALGTTETTAYRGDHGNAAYTHSQVTSGNPHGVTTTEIGALPISGGTVSGAIHYKQGAEAGECAISYDATKKCIKFSFS